MNAVEVNKYVIEEMEGAEENGEDVTIRLYLSNEDTLEIWFDKKTIVICGVMLLLDMKIYAQLFMIFSTDLKRTHYL